MEAKPEAKTPGKEVQDGPSVNIMELLFNSVYAAVRGNALAEKLVRAAADEFNRRMAEINRVRTDD